MNLDLVNIVAAAALILPTCAAGVLGYLNNSKGRRIKSLERSLDHAGEDLSEAHRSYAALKDSHQEELNMIRSAHVEALEDLRQEAATSMEVLNQGLRHMESQMFDLEQNPLASTPDDALPLVVRREVEKRVVTARQASLPFGLHAHKLATAVGGACFRVVDHCKRGHGLFQAFGPYAAPKADSTATLED